MKRYKFKSNIEASTQKAQISSKGLETEQDNIIDCDIKYKQQEIKTLEENKELNKLNKQRKLESSYFYNLTNKRSIYKNK
jgi:hypothetical protein